jgi:Mrp family chromosome partitioning ATPase
VDGDLRRRELSARLGAPVGGLGLIGLLRAETGRTTAETPLSGSGAAFIHAGTDAAIANSGDLLGSAAMRHLLDELKTRHAVILVDLPPAAEVSDVKAISPHLDGLVLVVEYDRTQADVAAQQVRALENAGARVLGVVLNKADVRAGWSTSAT